MGYRRQTKKTIQSAAIAVKFMLKEEVPWP
jgi:hypothetical protein